MPFLLTKFVNSGLQFRARLIEALSPSPVRKAVIWDHARPEWRLYLVQRWMAGDAAQAKVEKQSSKGPQ